MFLLECQTDGGTHGTFNSSAGTHVFHNPPTPCVKGIYVFACVCAHTFTHIPGYNDKNTSVTATRPQTSRCCSMYRSSALKVVFFIITRFGVNEHAASVV